MEMVRVGGRCLAGSRAEAGWTALQGGPRMGEGSSERGPHLVLKSGSRSRPGHFSAFSCPITSGCKGICEMLSGWAAMSPERGRTDLRGWEESLAHRG